MTHKKKDCFERPRRVGAKYTGDDIAPDEFIVPKLALNYDAKRDRWAGYDTATHQEKIEEFKKLEEARRVIRAEKMRTGELVEEEDANKIEKEDDEEDFHSDEDKYAEHADMPGVKVKDSMTLTKFCNITMMKFFKLDADSRTRITVRNLRIREDTAKYLHNLDPESAYYDPKSRSMRENPLQQKGIAEDEAKFGGENFIRYSGEVVGVNQAQLFAWEGNYSHTFFYSRPDLLKLKKILALKTSLILSQFWLENAKRPDL